MADKEKQKNKIEFKKREINVVCIRHPNAQGVFPLLEQTLAERLSISISIGDTEYQKDIKNVFYVIYPVGIETANFST